MPPPEQIAQIIQRLSQRTDEDIYAEIGTALSGSNALPTRRGKLIDLGRRWLDENRRNIAEIVCRDEKIRRLSRQDVSTHEIIVAICGALDLGSHFLGGAPVVTVSVLIVRLGLHGMCASLWRDHDTTNTQ